MQCESGRYWPRDAAEPSLKLSRIPNSCFTRTAWNVRGGDVSGVIAR